MAKVTRKPRQLDPDAIINRQILREAGVFTVSLSGAPGCGRTSIVNATAHLLEDVAHTAVIVANLASGRREYCADFVAQVETDCLDAQQVRRAIDKLPLGEIDLLLIENTVESDLGEQVRVAVFDVTGGDDKAAESAPLVRNASLVLLNKIDLLPRVQFNFAAFAADVAKANPSAPIIQISITEKTRLEAWVHWLNEQRLRKSRPKDGSSPDDWFMNLKLIDASACTCMGGTKAQTAKPQAAQKVSP